MQLSRLTVAALAPALFAIEVAAQAPNGEQLFQTQCAACHVNPPEEDIPNRDALAAFQPNAIVESLTDGNMRLQGERMSQAERAAVAEFLTGRQLVSRTTTFATGMCGEAPPLPTLAAGGIWNGWGPDVRNTRFQRDTGGLSAGDVPRLELSWAFGIPDATQSRAQPAIVGERLFMGSTSGAVYALDAATGCVYWTFNADSGVRTAISVGPIGEGASARYAIYFADAQARAYAVDAQSGELIWSYKLDDHPAARVTGAPTLHAGRLYVPTSGVSEETAASMPDYECCTFRGSLTSLDAETGALVWKTYTVPEPEPRGKSTTGAQLWGPAGSPIWSAPTIDAERGLIYAASGNAYADPDVGTSDAILAFSIATGAIEWARQITPGDVWILGCSPPPAGLAGGPPGGGPPPGGPQAENPSGGRNPNCPEEVGPDYDFSASPALITTPEGRDLLVITQKSGVGYALDPERRGETVWAYRWGQGSPVGGVWGTTTDGEQAYFATADQFTPAPGGLHAVDLPTGQRAWYTPPEPPLCGTARGCGPAQSAALTLMPGVVFSGSADGGMRAYSSVDGTILWTFDTNRAFETVNGVPATGGSIDGPGPVIAGGRLFVTAGNGGFVGTPGNVLLAFAVRDPPAAAERGRRNRAPAAD